MSKSNNFMRLVQQIRSKNQNPPSLEEITAEIDKLLYFTSEQVLAKDWLNEDEDKIWKNL